MYAVLKGGLRREPGGNSGGRFDMLRIIADPALAFNVIRGAPAPKRVRRRRRYWQGAPEGAVSCQGANRDGIAAKSENRQGHAPGGWAAAAVSAFWSSAGWAQDSLADPAGSSVVVRAVQWLQGTLLGTIATVVAVIAVASVGFLMLTGRINWRYGATVIWAASSCSAPPASSPVSSRQPVRELNRERARTGYSVRGLDAAQMFAGVTYSFFIAMR